MVPKIGTSVKLSEVMIRLYTIKLVGHTCMIIEIFILLSKDDNLTKISQTTVFDSMNCAP